MLEAIFIDAEFEGAAIDGRPVPAALTQCLIEGLLFQTMIQGTGLALLEMTLKALKPVRIGDTVWATVTVTGIKPTSRNNRAIIDSEIAVYNTRDEQVLSYTAKRMLAGRA
jgi:acyl dehydratase